jgi:hypothetical protein
MLTSMYEVRAATIVRTAKQIRPNELDGVHVVLTMPTFRRALEA